MKNNACPVCGCNKIKIQKTSKGRVFLCAGYRLFLKSVRGLRIKAVNESIIFCNIVFVLLILLKPVIDFFPKDIECLFFKKMR